MFRDPVSSRVFDHEWELREYLSDLSWIIYDEMPRKDVRERRRRFNQAYADLRKNRSVEQVFGWLAANPAETLHSPLIGKPLDKYSSPYENIRLRKIKFVNDGDWSPHSYPWCDLNHNIQGSGWEVFFDITMPTNQKPAFSSADQYRGFASLGIYPVHSLYSREDFGARYEIEAVMPAKEWREMAMLQKLAGNISGPISFEAA